MFVPPVAVGEEATLRPQTSGFSHADWHSLAGFWHPVAFSQEVADKPFAARLLDVELVLYRHAAGVTVALDRCPHRSVRLSHGHLCDQTLACAMHGLRFDGTGRCVAIPSAGEGLRIPERLQLQTFPSIERYGMVWTCLSGEPRWPLPEWPAFEVPGRAFYTATDTWQASAVRHVENFNDVAHFPWVHGGTFGGEAEWTVPVYEVASTPYGLSFQLPYLEGGNRFPDEAGRGLAQREVVYTYELTFPFSTMIVVDVQGSDFTHWFCDSVCPRSVGETRIFQIFTDTQGVADPAYWMADAEHINREDKPLVESQPWGVSLDGRDEGHIPADRMSLAYRRALAEKFGLGRA